MLQQQDTSNKTICRVCTALTLPQPAAAAAAALLSISRSHLLPSLARLLPICRREHEGLGGRSGGQGPSPEVNVRCRPTAAGPAPHTAAFFHRVQQTLLLRTGGRIGTTLLDTSHYLTHGPSFVHTHNSALSPTFYGSPFLMAPCPLYCQSGT